MNLESRILQPEDWELIAPIVRREDGYPMPSPQQSTFPYLWDSEADRLAGYVWVEHLYHLRVLRVMPEYRGQGLIAKRLLTEAAARIPTGHAMICLPDPKQERLIELAERLGARRLLSRVVLRKDVVDEGLLT